MKLSLCVPTMAIVAGFLFVAPAFAAPKKSTNAVSTATRPGTLVAMGGQGSLGSSAGSNSTYVGVQLFPLSMSSAKVKVGNTSVDTPSTSFRTMPKQLEFYGNFGSWVVRPTLDLDLNIAGNAVEENTSYLGVGYMLSSNLEVGAVVGIESKSTETADKTKLVSSEILIGPSAFYFTEVAGLQAEFDGRLFLIFGSAESTKDNTTTTTVDTSGFGFEAAANVVRELSSGLEYVGGVKLGYVDTTNKADKNNEISSSAFEFKIIPAGLRFKF